ncbi:MAG: DUF5131 family protein [Myxococcota bacterium]
MSALSSIEWTDATWNPVTGCTKVSAGCKNCYAEGVAKRFWGDRKFGDVVCHDDRLDQPLRWRKPRRVFVNSMSDLFHEDVPDEFIDIVFGVMGNAPEHTFQILTKRPGRMREWFKRVESMPRSPRMHTGYAACCSEAGLRMPIAPMQNWPYPNVWLGVSVENNEQMDRVCDLAETPAAVRFVSMEPLLEHVDMNIGPHGDFRSWKCSECGSRNVDPEVFHFPDDMATWLCDDCGSHGQPGEDAPSTSLIDWVIVGGESGPGARPCEVKWIRSIIEQCRSAGVACFVKQLGADVRTHAWHCGSSFVPGHVPPRIKLKSRKGSDPTEWPEDLRVREFPGA